ncbi:predicted protein [Naegleria gruberi]|uniref:Predicted protein n=1 Tax=Naegleria gruberi TaxID=5762 RepID=D2W157_NAEGR|nr:uncharacterized protein NAEGRDRAFT_53891 [Naegleria gruberi]EFC37123.1 predicted protein [Naegleria gruberi]|eukprot:XP_002669867.1 predicted protein [Naegleria gruberi strain NEG-M]
MHNNINLPYYDHSLGGEYNDSDDMETMYGIKKNHGVQQSNFGYYDDGSCKHCGASSEYIESDEFNYEVCSKCGTQVTSSSQPISIFREEIEFDKDNSKKIGRHVSNDEGFFGAYLMATSSDPSAIIHGQNSKAQARLQRQLGAKKKAEIRTAKLLSALKLPNRYLPEVMNFVCKMAEKPNNVTTKKSEKKVHSNKIGSPDSQSGGSAGCIYNLGTQEVIDFDEFASDEENFDEIPTKAKLESSSDGFSPERDFDPLPSSTDETKFEDDPREHSLNLMKQRFQSTLLSTKQQEKTTKKEEESESSDIIKFKYTKEKWMDGVIAGALYVVCRREKLPITLLDLSEVTGYSIFELGRKYKEICKTFNIQVDPLDLETLCDRMTNEFSDCFTDENGQVNIKTKTDINLRMRRIIRVAMKECLDSGRRPIALVAAALLLALQSCSIDMKLSEVARSTHVGEATIRERFNELKQLLMNLSKQLPWAHEITLKTLPRHLPFILDVVEQLRDLQRTRIDDESSASSSSDSPSNNNTFNQSFVSETKTEESALPEHIVKGNIQRILGLTKGKLAKEISIINSQLPSPMPPAFIKAQLEKERKKAIVMLAKQRIQNSLSGISNSETLPTAMIESDVLEMEKLLLQGVSEEALISGHTHLSTLPYFLGKDGVDKGEELTEMDVSQKELNDIMRSKEEIAALVGIREEHGDDIDAEISIKEVTRKRKKEEDDTNYISATLLNPSLKKIKK